MCPHIMLYYSQTHNQRKKNMPKETDRHTGTRENVWFPWPEHEAMLKAMALLHETNKSNFIRSAVRSTIEEINKRKGK